MKNVTYIVLLLYCSLGLGQNQKIIASKVSETLIEADSFWGFDGFGNYFFSKNNVVFKKLDTALLHYQNLNLGNISKVDVLNPLKIILFYKEFNSIVVLDNQMNEIQQVNFSKLNNPIVASAIGISGQNKIWVYNSLDQQIGLFDLNSNQYQNIGIPIREEFNYYQSDFNYFHWIDKQKQWNTCTIFGRVFSNGKIDDGQQVLLLDTSKVFFSKEHQLYIKDIKQNKLYEIEIVEKTFKNFYYKDQILSIFTDTGITNYIIKLP